MREIEHEYGLQVVAPSQEAERRAPTKGEIEQSVRTGAASTRQQLQALCDGAAQDCDSFTTYVERLEAVGVDVLPTVQQHGAKLSGLQYNLDGVTMKGSDLGKAYAAAGIQHRGISYEQDRDGPTVEHCRERAAAGDRGGPDRERAPGEDRERGGVGREAGAAGPSAGGLDGRDAPDVERDRRHEPGRGRGVAGRDAGGADGRRALTQASRRIERKHYALTILTGLTTAALVSGFWLWLFPPQIDNLLDAPGVAEFLKPALIEAVQPCTGTPPG